MKEGRLRKGIFTVNYSIVVIRQKYALCGRVVHMHGR